MKSPRRTAVLGVLVVAILPVGWSVAAETVTYPFFGVEPFAPDGSGPPARVCDCTSSNST